MKSRKKILSTLMGVALTSQMLPSTYTMVANAQTTSNTNVLTENQAQNSQNKLAETKVTLSGVGCQEGTHRFDISFNTKTNKLQVGNLVGLGYTGKHQFHEYFKGKEYIKITLLNQFGEIKKEFSLKGNDNVARVNDLNEWSFEYGDRLRLSHAEADWRVKISGEVTGPNGEPITGLKDRVSGSTLNTYDFEITPAGLHEINKNVAEISNKKDLINTLKSNKLKTIELKSNITINEEDLSNLTEGYKGSKELVIKEGVSINGNGHTINFQGNSSLTLAGNNISLSNLTVQFCGNIGMQVYNSQNVHLKHVTIENSKQYGLVVNASTVTLEDCTTRNNHDGGILITRSATIQGDKYPNAIDSKVRVIGTLNQENECNPKVLIKNLEMLDGRMQENTFTPSSSQKYQKSESEKSVTLIKDYCDILHISPDREFREKTIIYN